MKQKQLISLTRAKPVRKHLARIAILVLGVSAIISIPYIYFYAKYLRPDKIIPAVNSVSVDRIIGTDTSTASSLTDILLHSQKQYGLPSISAAVGYADNKRWAAAIGYADIERNEHAKVTSRYRLGSTSKALTGVLLARMLDEKLISLDQPLSQYEKTIPSQYKEVTARQLASHTAGIRHYSVPNWWLSNWENYSNKRYRSVSDGISLISDDKLLFSPGTDFKYSTFGYSLLALGMEGAGRSSFSTLLTEKLFTPAGMANTTLDDLTTMKNRVSFYNADSGKYISAIRIDSSYKIAGGGIVSTPTDLVTLGLELLTKRFVTDSAKQVMWTPVLLKNGKVNDENYGLGWRIDESKRILGEDSPVHIVHHGGVQPGGASFYMLVPTSGLVVAVTTNSGTSVARRAVQDVAYELTRHLITSKQVPK